MVKAHLLQVLPWKNLDPVPKRPMWQRNSAESNASCQALFLRGKKLRVVVGLGVNSYRSPAGKSPIFSDKYHQDGGCFPAKLCFVNLECSRVADPFILLMVQKSGDHQLSSVASHIIYKVLWIPGGAGFQPSTVVTYR